MHVQVRVPMACLVVASPLRNPFLRRYRVVASPLWVGAQRSASVLFVLLAVGLGYVCACLCGTTYEGESVGGRPECACTLRVGL